MTPNQSRREDVVERMADHLLRAGLAGASLRPLAAAAGTSDRMLLYYFADKDELLAVTLARVAARMAAGLDRALPPAPPRPFAALLSEVWAALATPELQPYMHLWLDLAAAAARGTEPHRTVAGAIADGFVIWIEARLDPDEPDRPRAAARLLALIEGAALLEALGRRSLAEDAVIG